VRVEVPPVAPGSGGGGGEQPEHRRVYLTRVDLDTYGYSEGCPGCDAAKSEARAKGHAEACRARLEAALAASEGGRDRLLRAAIRRAPDVPDEAPLTVLLRGEAPKRAADAAASDPPEASRARAIPGQGVKRTGEAPARPL